MSVQMLVLSPFLVALIRALLSAVTQGRMQRVVNLLGGLLLFGCSLALLIEVGGAGQQSLAVGAWPLPQTIEMVADGLSAAMVLLVAVAIVFCLIAAWASQSAVYLDVAIGLVLTGTVATLSWARPIQASAEDRSEKGDSP